MLIKIDGIPEEKQVRRQHKLDYIIPINLPFKTNTAFSSCKILLFKDYTLFFNKEKSLSTVLMIST